MSTEDKVKVVINMVHHFQVGEYDLYLESEYANYLLGIFSEANANDYELGVVNWLNVVRFIESNRHIFYFYGITANVDTQAVYYCGKRLFW